MVHSVNFRWFSWQMLCEARAGTARAQLKILVCKKTRHLNFPPMSFIVSHHQKQAYLLVFCFIQSSLITKEVIVLTASATMCWKYGTSTEGATEHLRHKKKYSNKLATRINTTKLLNATFHYYFTMHWSTSPK